VGWAAVCVKALLTMARAPDGVVWEACRGFLDRDRVWAEQERRRAEPQGRSAGDGGWGWGPLGRLVQDGLQQEWGSKGGAVVGRVPVHTQRGLEGKAACITPGSKSDAAVAAAARSAAHSGERPWASRHRPTVPALPSSISSSTTPAALTYTSKCSVCPYLFPLPVAPPWKLPTCTPSPSPSKTERWCSNSLATPHAESASVWPRQPFKRGVWMCLLYVKRRERGGARPGANAWGHSWCSR
jgi:hypothetical protein